MRFVEVDFETDNLEFNLRDAGFDEKISAVVLWEGVVSYLTESAVEANLAILARLLAPGSHLIITYVDRRALDADARVQFERALAHFNGARQSGQSLLRGALVK